MKIAVSGGHVTPALAVVDALQKLTAERGERLEVIFFGRLYSMEGDTTPSVEAEISRKRGYIFVPLTAGRIQRRFTQYTLPALFKIPAGFFQAFAGLRRHKTDVIISFGGYVSVPLVIAGWILHIPVLTHEQTAVSGLANRVDAWFARKIAVSFEESVTHFPKEKVIVTGNPIRQAIFEVREPNVFVSTEQLPTIYITGGSQGSRIINGAVSDTLEKLLDRFFVVHQCGSSKYGDYEMLLKRAQALPEKLKRRYLLRRYIEDNEIGSVYAASTIVVGRAGANTVTEMAALSKPCIFVPIPYSSNNEQMKNAKLLEDVGAARIIPENELTGARLMEEIRLMQSHLSELSARSDMAKNLVRRDAAYILAKEIYALYQETKVSPLPKS